MRNLHTIVHFIFLHQLKFPPTVHRFPFLPHSQKHMFFLVFSTTDNLTNMRSYLILVLICIFPIPKECWKPFHIPIDNLNIFFGEMSSNAFCPFKNLIICVFFFFCYWAVWIPYIFCILSNTWFINIFSHSLGCF